MYQPFPALCSFSLSRVIRVSPHGAQPAEKMVRRADQLLRTGRQLTPEPSAKMHLCITVEKRSSNVSHAISHRGDRTTQQICDKDKCLHLGCARENWWVAVQRWSWRNHLLVEDVQSWLKIVLDVQGTRIRVGAWQLPHGSSLEVAFKDLLQNRDFFPTAS